MLQPWFSLVSVLPIQYVVVKYGHSVIVLICQADCRTVKFLWLFLLRLFREEINRLNVHADESFNGVLLILCLLAN